MAKKIATAEMPENPDDDILLESFLLIKEGLIEGDWHKISEAYKNISGEEILPPSITKQSKLNKLRASLASNNEEELEEKPAKNNIRTIGRTKNQKTKEKIIVIQSGKSDKVLSNLENSASLSNQIEKNINAWGGSDERLVITSKEDEKEKAENKKVAKKVMKIKRPKYTKFVEDDTELSENDPRGIKYRNIKSRRDIGR